MRLVFAAALASLTAAPALAGSASMISVGLTVTGSFASPLAGVWRSRTVARGTIYQFVVSDSSGALYGIVSVPLANTAATGTCDLRIGGVIYSIEGHKSGYEMQYSIRSADVVTSSTKGIGCEDVAASYLSDVADSTRSMILSAAGDGRLIDGASGTEYVRTR